MHCLHEWLEWVGCLSAPELCQGQGESAGGTIVVVEREEDLEGRGIEGMTDKEIRLSVIRSQAVTTRLFSLAEPASHGSYGSGNRKPLG